MIIFIEDLLREVNILNWYRGEAAKYGDASATVVESNTDAQDALLYHMRTAVTEVLSWANPNNIKFTCEVGDEKIQFLVSPVREGREYLLELLRNCIKQFLVFEIRRLWMMNVRPEWADATMRESLRMNVMDAMSACTRPNRVRRRCAIMGI